MARRRTEEELDRELEALPEGLRWREWMRRVEAVLFASATPVARADLARVVGRGASLDLLIEDLRAELADRPYEIHAVSGAWALRTRRAYAPVIQAAADLGDRPPPLGEGDLAVLAAVAWRQPITRSELRAVLGAEIGREVIARLRARDLIAPGPRSPRPGAPQTFVTTGTFLDVFGLASLQDLTEMDAFDAEWGEGPGAGAATPP